jgi:3-oxoacyl-[acyl-carrier-protein] synthase II
MSTSSHSIVITGVGAISAIGDTAEATWAALEAGRSARAPLRGVAGQAACGAYVVDWRPEEVLGPRRLQFMRPSARYLCGAALLALREAGLAAEPPDPDDLGIVVSTNLAGLESITSYDWTAANEGPQYVSPMEGPNTLTNAPASHLAIRIQARALNTTIASGQCAGLDGLGYACRMLHDGRARYVVVGGVEELSPAVLGVYGAMHVLPRERPCDAGRPFDAASTGWLPGEGAAALVLETRSSALERGARPLATVEGWSSTFAPGEPAAGADGLARAIDGALRASGLGPEAVDLVMAGASGERGQDATEALALQRVFGKCRPDVPVCAVKGALGETYGAGGTFQAVAAVGALARATIPASAGLEHQPAGDPLLPGLQPGARSWPRRTESAVLLTARDLFGSTSAVLLQGC